MELSQLFSFYNIVKEGSFTKASEKLFRSPSAISHQIRKLEEELATRLLNRTPKGITMTDEGEILFDIVSKFISDLADIPHRYEEIKNCKLGNLKIAATSALITYELPQVIEEFLTKFINIKFKLITCVMTEEIPKMVLNDEVDYGIGPRMTAYYSPKISYIKWKTFSRILFGINQYDLFNKENITLEDISKYPLILLGKGKRLGNIIKNIFDQNNLIYNIAMEMDFAENIKKYVEMGYGISILPSFIFREEDKKRYELRDVSEFFGKSEYGIYSKCNRYTTIAMKEFLRCFYKSEAI